MRYGVDEISRYTRVDRAKGSTDCVPIEANCSDDAHNGDEVRPNQYDDSIGNFQSISTSHALSASVKVIHVCTKHHTSEWNSREAFGQMCAKKVTV